MKSWMIRFLCLSLLLLACAPAKPTWPTTEASIDCIKKFKPVFRSDLYNASIDVVGKRLSGLVLFKSMPDSSLRVVFTNEAGLKFFDFGFLTDGSFKAYSVIKQLNKKPVVKTLQQDFELILMRRSATKKAMVYNWNNQLKFGFDGKKDTDYIVTDLQCSKLIELEKANGNDSKTKAWIFGSEPTPDSIKVKHLNFSMEIKLKKLNR